MNEGRMHAAMDRFTADFRGISLYLLPERERNYYYYFFFFFF
jgi:hypothetical protein